MNILFLSLLDFETLEEHNIYTDLLREFVKNGNSVYAISPNERRKGKETYLLSKKNEVILKLKIGNVQKTNFIEKGISTITLEGKYVKGIRKFFNDVKFDLVLYTTPPITLLKAVEFVKKRDGAKTYLMLKDIFPQNAVDMEILSKKGIKKFLYQYFRRTEKRLYRSSDYIGCMSRANAEYLKVHNPEIPEGKIELCPNSMEPTAVSVSEEEKAALKKKYGIPEHKKIFVYGGNLGRPQGILHMMECIKSVEEIEECFFLIVGSGTEYSRIENFIKTKQLKNIRLYQHLPKDEYEKLVKACDIGLIFLDYRFTIPNFPSRLLAYMDAGIPVLAVTDRNTDIGTVITENEFGWWCESNSIVKFEEILKKIMETDKEELKQMSENAKTVLRELYSSDKVCRIIQKRIKSGEDNE